MVLNLISESYFRSHGYFFLLKFTLKIPQFLLKNIKYTKVFFKSNLYSQNREKEQDHSVGGRSSEDIHQGSFQSSKQQNTMLCVLSFKIKFKVIID